MKKGIFVALAALALTVFAVPDAYGKSGPDVDQDIFAHVIFDDIGEPGGLTSSVANGIAKGQPGKALITGVLVFETTFVPGNPFCPEGWAGSNIVRFEWGQTYNDGSLLAGFVDSPQAFCTNGIVTIGDLTGAISGGTGRFEGASGRWKLVASSPTTTTATTGTLTVEFN